jgi:hypothetical protein
MTFVNVDDDFRAPHARVLRELLDTQKANMPKCVIFTHSTNEVITIKNLIVEVIDGKGLKEKTL